MDIIDDAVVVLRVVLDYLGVDIEDLTAALEELNARRRERIYNTRQTISYHWNRVVERRQRIYNILERVQNDVCHRSLIRIIGTYCPRWAIKPMKRIKIQNHLLRSRRQKFMYDSDSDDSVISTTSVFSTTDEDDVVWVEEEIGENCVRIRAQKRRNLDDTDVLDEIDEGLFIARPSMSPMSSTMISSVSSRMNEVCDADQTHKISHLEDELNRLRQQMAMLVEAQEHINKSYVPAQSFIEDKTIPRELSPVVPVAPPCPVAPPPPPPPPVPGIKQSTPDSASTEVKQRPALQPIQENRSTPVMPDKQPTLTDVLKGLGSVKLRSVQRSPGGTPIKPNPRRRESNSDPASVIAQALKKKFANQVCHSPDVDRENDSCGFSSPDTDSPLTMAQRKVKRRSLLFDEKTRLSGPIRI